MFTIDVLPAQRGDCLWLTYGTATRQRHVLIDGGPQDTIPTLLPELERRIKAVSGGKGRIELLVVTHIDADHIQGVVSLLSAPGRLGVFRDVWFNGFQHHDPDQLLGGVDAERLTTRLLEDPTRWNAAFAGRAVRLTDDGAPAVVELRDGLTVTVLGPTREALTALAPDYLKSCIKAGIVAGQGQPSIPRTWQREEFLGGGFDPDLLGASRTTTDPSKPNGASIILVAEYDGKRVLLTGDASSKGILTALDRLGPGPHRFDAVKISHHGSRNNTSLAVAERIDSPLWLVSSNGASFGHPDGECLGRIVVSQQRPTFCLNYVTDRVTGLIAGAGERYRVRLPKKKRDGTFEEGISISL